MSEGGQTEDEIIENGGIDVSLISPREKSGNGGEEEEAVAAESLHHLQNRSPPPLPPPPFAREVRSAPPFPRASTALPEVWPALMTPDDAAEAFLMEEAEGPAEAAAAFANAGGIRIGVEVKTAVFSFDPAFSSGASAAASEQRLKQHQQRRRPFSAIRAVQSSAAAEQRTPLALVSNPAFEVSKRGEVNTLAETKTTTKAETKTPRPAKRKQEEEEDQAISTPDTASAAVEIHRSHFVSPVASAGKTRAKDKAKGNSNSSNLPATSSFSPDALAALESRRRELQDALARLREAKEARQASWVEGEEEEGEEGEEEEEPRPRSVLPPAPLRVF